MYLLFGSNRSIWLFLAALFAITLPHIAHPQDKAGTQVQADALTMDQIVTRMEAERVRTKQTPPFLMTREYKMFHGQEQKPASEVTAQINVVPPHERDYKIIESKGSDRGENVVRKILDHEASAEKSNPSPTAVIHENYDFTLLGREKFEGVNCYVLGLKPKRQEPSLVEGRAWVDPTTFAVRKIEGKMAKSPSWWVRNVNLVVHFGEIGGIWTQTASSAVADVRVIGRYTVSGRALDVQTASSMASNSHPQKKILNRRHDVAAAFLYGPAATLSRR
jgi:hypothetical protein